MPLHHLAPIERSLLFVGPRGDKLMDRVFGRKVFAAIVELAIDAEWERSDQLADDADTGINAGDALHRIGGDAHARR